MRVKERLAARWLDAAYRGDAWLIVLRPVEWLYRWLVAQRARRYASGTTPVWHASVPVIIVGNITLGGTGKSPLVAWLSRWLSERGWRPGIVARGYGGRAVGYPLRVTRETPTSECGDEPRMLAEQTGVPVVVDPDRPRGACKLVEAGCDILLSDDGLQHLALGRDVEIVVVDGRRGFGNGRCLPAGPLREPLSRLGSVSAVVVNGEPRFVPPDGAYVMALAPVAWRSLNDGRCVPLTPLPFSGPVNAIAGIGNPRRFQHTLERLGVTSTLHAFADHHVYRRADFARVADRPLVMTAKDAVKCRGLAPAGSWVLDVEAVPEPSFVAWLEEHPAMRRPRDDDDRAAAD
ncbi:tetraacyldisaccharide 4'-kinase [Halomonas korlensis]|uniref:Tetraacyldisaccharide 4'-kinase n=1 Tax=Halomonas korlensis TaxID=463301 RepID=A0A1I7JYK4_9GAMM|nr:tetraacyldisaccharide 4'-kinase [Halomonas korlensis]SFU90310.1 lipid-A-disaccharide kinase [Halomonas korlensis]